MVKGAQVCMNFQKLATAFTIWIWVSIWILFLMYFTSQYIKRYCFGALQIRAKNFKGGFSDVIRPGGREEVRLYLLAQSYQTGSHHSNRYWEWLYYEENYRMGFLVMGFPEVIYFIFSTKSRNKALKTNNKHNSKFSIWLPRNIVRCLNNVFLEIWFFTLQAFFHYPCCLFYSQ